MKYPKVLTVKALDNYQLLVEFSTHEYRCYDVKPLLDKAMFEALRNPGVFKNVQVEPGGYAVSWNNDIDISEYELWCNGHAVDKIDDPCKIH
jgi:hypothetical protein